jgi:hypothetical protein
MSSTQSIWSKIMRKIILLCASLFTMVLLFSVNPVLAQSVLWVAATGTDGNACSQTAPCATFQGAVNKGNVAQINCLTSGSYGPVLIGTSLTIDCGTGNIGDVNISGGNAAISINASSAATIILRHLNLNGLGSSAGGIITSSFSGTLIVEDCMIHGFTSVGIAFMPTNGRGLLQVSNSQIFGTNDGINVGPPSGQIASVTLNNVELVANAVGVFFSGSGVVAGTMRSSVVGENTDTGVFAESGQVFFTIEESSIVDNLTTGIRTNSAGSAVKVGASTIGGNGMGVLASQGSIVSFGNNQISDNGSDGSFTSTMALK